MSHQNFRLKICSVPNFTVHKFNTVNNENRNSFTGIFGSRAGKPE